MNWERAIGPGWGDPLIGAQVQQLGGGASPILIIAIAAMLAAVLILICEPKREA